MTTKNKNGGAAIPPQTSNSTGATPTDRHADLRAGAWNMQAANLRMVESLQSQLRAAGEFKEAINTIADLIGDRLPGCCRERVDVFNAEFTALQNRIGGGGGVKGSDLVYSGRECHTAAFQDKWRAFGDVAYGEKGGLGDRPTAELAKAVNDIIPTTAPTKSEIMRELMNEVRVLLDDAGCLFAEVLRERTMNADAVEAAAQSEAKQ